MEFFTFINENRIVLLIPFFSALVGWFTNVVAIKMMFYPTEFVGIKPYLGWQGIIPANAIKLAKYSTRLITTKLISLENLFRDFAGENFAGENLEHVVNDITEQLIQEVATKHAQVMWDNAGEVMQEKVREQVRDEVRILLGEIIQDFGDNIMDILNLEEAVMDVARKDKALMRDMFRDIGEQEFKFIERSGIWFGFLFGLIQMAIWIFYPLDWILPAAGFFVGFATNWVAIKLIFNPPNPVKVGPITFHGLFHKRQQEVASEFANLTATRVLNADNLVQTVMTGEAGEIVFGLVKKRIDALIAKYEKHPMAVMMMPSPEQVEAIKEELWQQIREDLPKPGGLFHTFAGKAVDIESEIRDRMSSLDADSFEGVLRPAFQQDEWKLVLAGAVLGFLAGLAQLVYIFGDFSSQLDKLAEITSSADIDS